MLKWLDPDDRPVFVPPARLLFWLAAALYILAVILVIAGWSKWFSFLADNNQTLLTLVQ